MAAGQYMQLKVVSMEPAIHILFVDQAKVAQIMM